MQFVTMTDEGDMSYEWDSAGPKSLKEQNYPHYD